MNRGELRQEVKDLGHNYGTAGWDARVDRFLNQGAKDVMHEEPWPQRRVTALAVVAGAAVPLLGPIKQVMHGTTKLPLTPAQIDELRDDFVGPVPTGEPCFYYVVQNSVVSCWPTRAGLTVDVDHVGRGIWLAADGITRKVEATIDSDTLLGGDIFEEAVLLAARVRVLEDTDETDLRESLQQRLRGSDGRSGVVGRLRDQELNRDSDEPLRIKQTRPWY